jgi:hypothetical protein
MSTGKDFVGTGPVRDPGQSSHGWAMFTGLALIMIGVGDVLRGLNWSSYDEAKIKNVFGIDNPDTWATIFLVVGIVVIFAGFGAFTRARWARWVGIAAVFLAAIINAFFMMSEVQSIAGIGFALDLFLLYALTVRWDEGKAS